VVFLAVVFLAVVFFAGLAFLAADVVLAAAFLALDTVAVVTLGSFFAPETTAFSSAPARNFGTALFFARTR
jgi:hypothetical protein